MGRRIINFNTNWLYSAEDIPQYKERAFDDSRFEKVCLPHANRILAKHKGPDFQREIDSYRFVSWYRRHFAVPSGYDQGNRIMVEFEAVANAAEIYVNGEYVTEHKGAYTGFTVDITDYVSIGGDNVIAVRADSTKRADIPPEGHDVDYCLFGGIVRNVRMIVTTAAYIENTFNTTPQLAFTSGARTAVATETTVLNSGEGKEYSVETQVIDAQGRVCASSESEPVMVKSGETAVIRQSTNQIESPWLWDTESPYLYTVVTRLKGADGEYLDDVSNKLGMRWFAFEDGRKGSAGFVLNGRETKLVGVNRHEQWPWIGRAVVDRLQAADADLIKQTGFNAVRCSHYPQSPAFLSRCDELGIIVFEEAPGWQHIGDEEWQKLYIRNVEEMILRDRNHPCIATWGVRVNESDDCDSLYTKTNALAARLDSTRLTHGVRRFETYDGSFLEGIFTANYRCPEVPKYTPFFITEHCCNCWTNGYGFPWASDEESLVFAQDFADKVNYYFGNKLCAGGFAWSMFDYNNEVNYTNTDNVFYSGLYDIFRLPKPAANVYKSQKDPEKSPMVYISNYWDDGAKPIKANNSSEDTPQSEDFSVTVMSNCDTVELYVNGRKLDIAPKRRFMSLPHPLFVFEGLTYAPGEIRAVGYISGSKAAEDIRLTPKAPARLILKPKERSIAADGADFAAVAIYAVDENGTEVHSAANKVTITVEGAGRFIGESEIELEGGHSAFFVQSRLGEVGKVKCRAESKGLAGAECEIETLSFTEETVPV